MDETLKEFYEIIGSLKMYIEYQKMCGVDHFPADGMSTVKEADYIDMEETLAKEVHDLEVSPVEIPEKKISDKEQGISVLKKEIGNCTRCRLSKSRTKLVFGEGSLNAKLVFVGEAPGRDEDLSGRPFVGRAGQLLTKIINAMGLKRHDVYIMNIVKCRPPQNRNPQSDEINTCEPFMLKQLEIIKPKIICALGTFSAHTLLKTDEPISRLRGKFYDYHGIKLMPTYHPAYLLRNPNKKREVWEDIQLIMRNYNK